MDHKVTLHENAAGLNNMVFNIMHASLHKLTVSKAAVHVMDSSTNVQAPPQAAYFFDLVIRFITNRKYAFLFSRSDCQLTL